MFNTRRPSMSELPTVEQLNRSTKKAAIAAVAILITIVLPAEYGIDPTRIGRVFGLTRMGEIKQSLAEEAKKQDAAKLAAAESKPEDDSAIVAEESSNSSSSVVEVVDTGNLTAQLAEDGPKSDSMTITIVPNGSAEIKAAMLKGAKIQYSWSAEGGPLNFNVHGEPSDPNDGSSYEYDDGLGETQKDGTIKAAFDGTHGWYWRNRSGQNVTLTITVDGDFSSLKEI